jgi:hypothetical protein
MKSHSEFFIRSFGQSMEIEANADFLDEAPEKSALADRLRQDSGACSKTQRTPSAGSDFKHQRGNFRNLHFTEVKSP